jgi:hypothetical protein
MRTRLIMVSAALAAIAVAWIAQNFRARISSDPALCASCHDASPDLKLWNGGSHARLACQKCHHNSTEQGVAMLAKFVVSGRPRADQHSKVRIGDCEGCHLTHDRIWSEVAASRGHRVHALQEKIACVRCHGSDAHRVEPQVDSCRECHGEHSIQVEGMQRLHCFACHDFLSVETDLKPGRRDCLRCHSSRGVDTANFPERGPMRFKCAQCHRPHEARAAVACQSCHGEITVAGLHRATSHSDCLHCHRPHAWTSRPADCLRCHVDAATHAATKSCTSCHGFRAAPVAARR